MRHIIAASARFEAEIPPISVDSITLVWPRPPVSRPTSRSASRSRRVAMPALPKSVPSSTKNGIASRDAFSAGDMNRWTAMASGTGEKNRK